MSATYNNTLPSDRDWVRFLVGDTNIADAQFEDEEIDAVLTEETATGAAKKYFAAANLLEAYTAELATAGNGLISKTVGRLSKMWGFASATSSVIHKRISFLRRRGAHLLSTSPYVFRTAGDKPLGVRG